MQTARTFVLALALGAGVLVPAVSQAHTSVHVGIGIPPVVISGGALSVAVGAPAPVMVVPGYPVHYRYVEHTRYVPVYTPMPRRWNDGPRHDRRDRREWRDQRDRHDARDGFRR